MVLGMVGRDYKQDKQIKCLGCETKSAMRESKQESMVGGTDGSLD